MTDFAQERHEAQERIAASERAVVEAAVAWQAAYHANLAADLKQDCHAIGMEAARTEVMLDTAVQRLLALRAEEVPHGR